MEVEEEEVGLVGQEGMDKEATAKAVKVEVTGKVDMEVAMAKEEGKDLAVDTEEEVVDTEEGKDLVVPDWGQREPRLLEPARLVQSDARGPRAPPGECIGRGECLHAVCHTKRPHRHHHVFGHA